MRFQQVNLPLYYHFGKHPTTNPSTGHIACCCSLPGDHKPLTRHLERVDIGQLGLLESCGVHCSYLMLELWDLDLAGLTTSEAMADLQRAQPFLVAARGQAPQVYYNASSSTWSFGPANSLSDAAGQSILRPYLRVMHSTQIPHGTSCMPSAWGFIHSLQCDCLWHTMEAQYV